MALRSPRRRVCVFSLVVVCSAGVTASLVSVAPAQESVPDAVTLLRLYRARSFEAVEASLARVRDWAQFRLDLERAIAGAPFDAGAAFSLEAGVRAALAAHRNAASAEHAVVSQLVRSTLKRLPDSGVAQGFERRWLLAAMALVQGFGVEAPARGAFRDLYEHAIRRFSSDASVRLAALIHEEQELFVWHLVQGVEVARADSASESEALVVAKRRMAEIAAGYRKLGADATVGAEARLRIAMMRLMRREFELALSELLSPYDSSSDPALGYLRLLLEGHALAELGRWRDAAAAYDRALVLHPGAQSAQLSLAGVLYVEGRPDAAEERVRRAIRDPVDNDPWASYHYGEFRRLAVRMRAMRDALQ